MQYYLSVEKNEVQVHATTWMNPEIMILSEKTHFQKTTYKYCMNPLLLILE